MGLETQAARLAENLQRRAAHLDSLEQQVLQLRARKQAQQDLLHKLNEDEAWISHIITSIQVSTVEIMTHVLWCRVELHF